MAPPAEEHPSQVAHNQQLQEPGALSGFYSHTPSRASCSSSAPAPRGPAGGPGAQPLRFLFLPTGWGRGGHLPFAGPPQPSGCRRPPSLRPRAHRSAGSQIRDLPRRPWARESAQRTTCRGGIRLPRLPVLHSEPTSAQGPASPLHGEVVQVRIRAADLTMARASSHCHAASRTLIRPELHCLGNCGGALLPLAHSDDENVPARLHDAVLTMHNSALPNCTHLKVPTDARRKNWICWS
uniref:uncharacterized protein LOC117720945 n=1 Tax=Arvicanthis niloticus TaxID=61156 RepID=UPI001486C5A2|nr:uncharacterized protein LOC117720945 [Arvicanthis niloticus]